jgi:hypothetical protein
MRHNPDNNVVRVGVDPKHGEALRLRLEPLFKRACVKRPETHPIELRNQSEVTRIYVEPQEVTQSWMA